jgi:single-stranded DNA-binding protein
MNRCFLLGMVSKHGVELTYTPRGTAKAAFLLVVTELGSDGKAHQLWQPVEIWGRRAPRLEGLKPGAWVVVDGKLTRTKRGESWETVVSGYEAQPL